jgi:acyl-CoA synthetase (NDP forming)
MLSGILTRLTAAGHNGPVVVYTHNMPERRLEDTLATVLAERKKQAATPVVILAPGGLSEPIELTHRRNGIVIFHDIATCFESLAAYDFVVNRKPPSDHFAITHAPRRAAELRRLFLGLVARGKRTNVLTELESADVLRLTGMRVVDSRIVHTSEAAVTTADRIGYPVVLKAVVPGLARQYNCGLVITRINSAADIRNAYATLEGQIAFQGLSCVETRIVVQPMLSSAAELIVGVIHERNLGYFLMVGLGGIMAEVVDRTVLMPMPTNIAAIRNHIEATPIGRLLVRIDTSGGITAQLLAALEALQLLVMNYESMIESIDVNPLIITSSDCVVLDAVIVLKPSATGQ